MGELPANIQENISLEKLHSEVKKIAEHLKHFPDIIHSEINKESTQNKPKTDLSDNVQDIIDISQNKKAISHSDIKYYQDTVAKIKDILKKPISETYKAAEKDILKSSSKHMVNDNLYSYFHARRIEQYINNLSEVKSAQQQNIEKARQELLKNMNNITGSSYKPQDIFISGTRITDLASATIETLDNKTHSNQLAA